ncbi:MarP family serine protease [Luteipulveratus mongoliensis]|uniref:MarP family serine protease n=1 Tax=Luteipulveratus mongoliensis TaxID=571913 RepID=UPI0014704BAB|nr:MarP family serine protease [Luteipulveratus mongoliensis]
MIDLLLLLAVGLSAFGGWHRGFVTSALSATGWLAGLFFGLWAVPGLIDALSLRPDSDVTAALVVILVALVIASICAALLGLVGRLVVGATDWHPIRMVDASLGAVAMALVAMVAGWAILSSARPLLSADASERIDSSHGWRWLDRSMPDGARSAVGQLNDQLQTAQFPEVFHADTSSAPVPVPGDSVTKSPAITAARDSIFKIRSTSDSCRNITLGSGWVVSKNRIVTNAHVVAGGEQITVQAGGEGPRLRARVVAFDPDLDLAILRVPGLDADSLPRVANLARGATAVAAGFPNGGDYHLAPAAVRDEGVMGGRDIYGSKIVNRDIFTLSATVIQGNSGGPLITPDGHVAGTIFAKAEANKPIGFALTDKATDALLDSAPSLVDKVPTGACRE